MKTMTVCTILALLLAGCSGSDVDPTPQEGSTITDATGKKVVNEAPSNETVRTDSGRAVAANKAIVHGRVHDDFNFSLSGAFVSVLGTSHFTQTNRTGHYILENVTVGTFDLRFEMDQFQAREERVSLKAGASVRVDAQLDPLVPRSGGFNPHLHDFWGAATTRIIMDHDLPVNGPTQDGEGPAKSIGPGPVDAAQCMVNTCRFQFTLPDQDDGMPATIWPGTKEIRVTASWSGPTMAVSKVRIDYATPDMAGIERTPGPELGNGDTGSILVAPEHQDHGHAAWTAWRFTAVTLNSPTAPGYVSGTFHFKIELVKGSVVLDPPHQDHWQGRTQMPIGDWERTYVPATGVLPTRADSTNTAHAFLLAPCPPPEEGETTDCVSVVPPGTARLEVLFRWLPSAQGPAPFDYSMRYRTADQHPFATPASAYGQPILLDEDLAADWRLYEIPVEPGQTDSFYMHRSDWGFKWVQDTGLAYNIGQHQYNFKIHVTAFKG